MTRHFDSMLLGSMELFCAAAEHGSFTAAATATGVTPAAVSRSIARLEQRLGVRLFVRTTRQIRLTEAGSAYYARCRQAIAQLIDAEREVTGQQAMAAGTVRISMATAYGHYRVLPLLAKFRQRHPAVAIEAHLSNHNVDFAEDGFDLAIRARAQPDSGLVVRKLEDAELLVVASPDYLRRAGTPASLDALAAHECVQFIMPSSGRRIPWAFRVDGEDVRVETSGAFCCAEDVLGGVSVARGGGGLFQTYRYIVEADLRAGTLVEVLKDYGGRSRPFSIVYPHGRHLPSRVRACVDFLVEELAA